MNKKLRYNDLIEIKHQMMNWDFEKCQYFIMPEADVKKLIVLLGKLEREKERQKGYYQRDKVKRHDEYMKNREDIKKRRILAKMGM